MGGGGGLLGKGGNSPPPAPNYGQAAQQSQTSQFTNQYTPYGSQVYSPDASAPSGYRSDISLSPQAQATLNSQMGLSQNLANLGQQQLGNVNQQYSHPMDMSSVGDIANQSYAMQTARLDPQWQQNEQMEKTQLANQGLAPGGEAYNNAMRVFGQQKNDAYNQARLSSIQTMPQTYQLALSQREQPLNELNAIRTGAQVQNPQFTPMPGANYLGASQAAGNYNADIYNAQQGGRNALTGGLFGLGGALGSAYMMGK